MKNIQFNSSKFIASNHYMDMMDSYIDEQGKTVLYQKPINNILPLVNYFDITPEVNDIYLVYVGHCLSEYYETLAPKGWPGKYANLRLDPGIYHAKVTNIYSDHLFYKFEEKPNSIESMICIRNSWPSNWYLDIKDIPESKITFIDIEQTF